MSTNNKVFQVLVSKGNQAPLAKDKTLDDLAVGQLGIFDHDTNISIDGTKPVRNFYIAMGIDSTGGGTKDEVAFSAGQMIQKENIRDYNFRPHTAGQEQIFEITGYEADCETDYAVKFEFRNMEIYRRQGYNQFMKTFAVRTGCCSCESTCPSGSVVELTKLLFHAINMNSDGMFTVQAIEAAGGAVIADIDAYAADPANKDKKPGLRITVHGLKVNDFCNINMHYFNPRQTIIIPSLTDGFKCTGKIETTQQAVAEEGNGYDIKQKEYNAGGFNGRPGPYRVYTVTGLPQDGFQYHAVAGQKYDQIHLVYDQFSTSGWGEYLNNLMTNIAIPEADTTTRDGFVALLDKVLASSGFPALAEDASKASPDPVVVEKTSKKNTPPTTP